MRTWKNGYFEVFEGELNEKLNGFIVYYNRCFVGVVVPQDLADQEQIIKALDAGADPIAEGWEDVDGNVLEYPVEA